jgi:hypothetical protein
MVGGPWDAEGRGIGVPAESIAWAGRLWSVVDADRARVLVGFSPSLAPELAWELARSGRLRGHSQLWRHLARDGLILLTDAGERIDEAAGQEADDALLASLPPHLRDPAALHAEQVARQMMGLPPLEVHGWGMQPVWTCWLLSPKGDVLDYFTTPYWHGESPYTVIPALHVDGETWGVVAGVEDPQKWLNQTLSTLDHNMRTSGRGTTFIDDTVLRDSGLTQTEFDEARMRGDATIAIKKGNLPWDEVMHHEAGVPLPAEAFAMMDRLPVLMDSITGISAAARGSAPAAGTSGVRYEREVAQANVNIFPFVDSYFDGLKRKDLKEVRNVQQCVDRPSAFRDARSRETVPYDPAAARAMRFDVTTGEGMATPERRQLEEMMLREDAQAGMISPTIYYTHSRRQDAASILRDVQEEQLLQAQMALAAGPPEEEGAPSPTP